MNRLSSLLPELAADIQGALVHLGRGDLADQVRDATLAGWSRDAFAQAIDLHTLPLVEGRPPGEIFALYDELGVSLELDGSGRLARIEVTGYEAILARLEDLRLRVPLFTGEGFRAVEMFAWDAPRLQAFFDANPDYFRMISGAAPSGNEAREQLEALPPADWPFTRKWCVLFVDGAGEVIASADLLADLFAPGVWHVGLFIVSGELHGTGRAAGMYAALEAWMRSRGARWVRLGVVEANARGERFWRGAGFTEVRQRAGYEVAGARHLLKVMAKPLGPPDWDRYRRLVPRDDPAAA
jgi:GNAT superfamily N-acetyltransferase